MTRVRRDKARKKLNELLSLANDEEFVIMVWAIDALQSGQVDAAARYLNFPNGAEKAALGDNLFVLKWALETLVNELLITTKKRAPRKGKSRALDCRQFDTVALLVNTLRDLEDAEDGMVLTQTSVLDLIHKIGHRQFEWQRGFSNLAQIYRSLFVFGGCLAKEHFEKTHQVTIADFFLCGFAFYALVQSYPGFELSVALSDIALSGATRDAALRLLTAPLEEVRSRAIGMRQAGGRSTAYQQSVLRRTPAIVFRRGDRLVARVPLPALMMQRITSGLYYDLVGGGSKIWREIGARFESYCLELACAALPGTKPTGSFKYRFRKDIDSPDVFLHDANGATKVAIECKAKKMSIVAKFSGSPLDDAREAFSEIIKGVMQIWRFYSHCRRSSGIKTIAPDAIGMVLTLDPWLQASTYLDRVMAEAHSIAGKADPDIVDEDRRAILFCSIEEFEAVLSESSEASFLAAATAAATDPNFRGWLLSSVHDRTSQEHQENAYPFRDRITELLPSWERFNPRPGGGAGTRAALPRIV